MSSPQVIPVVVTEALNLIKPPLSLPADNVKFGWCTMQSDKFITICQNSKSYQQIAIVDLTAGNTLTRYEISAEAAIMNPLSRVIALKAGQQLQIFDLELRLKMKSYAMPDLVTYWRWISPNTIALVTSQSVFHWYIEDDSFPHKIFDRNPALGIQSQILNYQVSNDNKWCLLVGICAGATIGGIDGYMQLFSTEKCVSQILQGHAGVFATINIPGRTGPSPQAQVLIFEEKKPNMPAKLFIVEVGRDKSAPGGIFRATPQNIPFPADAANDFPVAMNVSKKYDLIYIICKMGYLYLYDIFTGKLIYRSRITQETVLASAEHIQTGGILCISRRGQVLSVGINEECLVPYIVDQLRDLELAIQIASRLNFSGVDDLYIAQFQNLLTAGDVAGAARVAAASPRGLLRTPQTIARFQQVPAVPGQPQPVFQYFSILLEKGKLNQLESVELTKTVIQQGRSQLLDKWISDDKLELSEELGDLVVSVDVNLASSIYLRVNSVPVKFASDLFNEISVPDLTTALAVDTNSQQARITELEQQLEELAIVGAAREMDLKREIEQVLRYLQDDHLFHKISALQLTDKVATQEAELTRASTTINLQLQHTTDLTRQLQEVSAALSVRDIKHRENEAQIEQMSQRNSELEKCLQSMQQTTPLAHGTVGFQRYDTHVLLPGILPVGAELGHRYPMPPTSPLFLHCEALCLTGGSWLPVQRPVAGFRLVSVEAVKQDEHACLTFSLTKRQLTQLRDQGGAHFNFNLSRLSASQLHILSTLREHYHEVAPGTSQRAAKTFYCFHGPRREHLDSICVNGIVATRAMDAGYFGSGCYATLNIEYAVRYARGEFDADGGASRADEARRAAAARGESKVLYPVVMLAACVSLPYPVSPDVDYMGTPGTPMGHSDYFGRPLKPGFDCHVVCVSEASGLQAVNRNECQYMEVVIDQRNQLLPVAVLWFE